MSNYKFNIKVRFFGNQDSILQIAQKAIALLYAIKNSNPLFDSYFFVGKKGNIDLPIVHDFHLDSQTLAEMMLSKYRNDIKRYEKENNPTIHFCRPIGYTLSFGFRVSGKEIFTLCLQMGNALQNSIGFLSYHGEKMDFSFCFSVLEIYIQTMLPLAAKVAFRDEDFLDRTNVFDYSLGWITYFSNEYPVFIPEDLPGMEYLKIDSGKYLVATRDEFIDDELKYTQIKEFLIESMKRIEAVSPNYRKPGK